MDNIIDLVDNTQYSHKYEFYANLEQLLNRVPILDKKELYKYILLKMKLKLEE